MAKTIRSTFIALAAAIVATFAFASVAGAQTDGPYVGNTVVSTPTPPKGEVLSATSENAPVAAAAKTEVKGESLAFTGSDATTLALVGTVAVLAGGAILVVRRRTVS